MLTIEQRLRNLEAPRGQVDCILDTDTYNEIDDQFALSLLLKSENCHTRAICAAPFYNGNSTSPENGMERSYDEILNLLTLMGNEEMKQHVFKGSRTYLPDEKTPVDSPAAHVIAEIAMEYSVEHPLYVVAIGAITNVASALLLQPEIADRMVVVWLGGHDKTWPDTNEFNMMQDVAAARVVFGCGVPLVQVPCAGVVSAFYTTKQEMEYWLRGKNALCEYLCDHSIEQENPNGEERVWSRVIWDVVAVAWLLNADNRYMQSVLEPTPIPEYDHHYGFDTRRPLMRRVTSVRRDALFGTLFATLAK